MPWQDHFSRDDLIERIRELAEDHDVSQRNVAKAIGHGLTGNMVRGLANRAKPKIVFGRTRAEERQKIEGAQPAPAQPLSPVVAQKSRSKTAFSAEPPKVGRLSFVILDEVEEFSEAAGPIHFDDLRSAGGLETGVPPAITDGRCRYPLWPDRLGTHYRPRSFEMFLCGKPVVPGTSWCPDCTKNVFEAKEPAPRPKRDPSGRRSGWELGT